MGGLLVAALVLSGLPMLIYVSVRTGDLARIEVTGDALVVRPRGLNRVWALKREVRVPLSQVVGVHTGVARDGVPSGFRVPGTAVPGLIQAGTYRKRGQKSFWLVGRTQEVTVVHCRGGRYDRIVLQLDDRAEMELLRATTGRSS